MKTHTSLKLFIPFLCLSLSYATFETREITVESGSVLELVIPSNHTTGYAWQPSNYDTNDIINITSNYESTSIEIGGGGNDHFQIELAPGVQHTTICFEYAPQYSSITNFFVSNDKIEYKITVADAD